MRKLTRNKGKDYLVYREGQNDTTEIYDIAVTSNRLKGVGTELIDELKEKTKGNLFAFMRKSNLIAKAFYLKNGFDVHHIPKFYPDEDAYLITWKRK